MNRVSAKSTIVAGAGVTLALAASLGWFELRTERRTDAALAEVATRRAALEAAIRRDEDRIAADQRARQAMPAAPGTVPPAPAPRPAGSAVVAALLAANPALFALGVRAYRANLGPHFAPLYRSLGLAPAQIAAFENLMIDHEEALLDLKATAAAQGLDDSDPAVLAVRQQEDDQLRAAQTALLGEAGYQQLLQLGRVQPVEDIVSGVATTVALTSTPLSRAQAAELTEFLANASSSYRRGDPADPATIDWDVALPQAQGILSAPQFGALKAEALKPAAGSIQAELAPPASAAR
jgi:hypothetical protein